MFDLQIGPLSDSFGAPPLPADAFARVAARERLRLSDPALNVHTLVSEATAVELLLAAYWKQGEESMLTAAVAALTRLPQSAAWDAEGGFVRAPGAPRLLADQAALVRAYLHAYQITGETALAEYARRAIEFIRTHLYDADESYFYWQVEHAEPGGAWVADKTFCTDVNAQMVEAAYEGLRVLDETALQRMAGSTLGRVGEMYEMGIGLCHASAERAGEPRTPGRLSDYACAIQAHITGSEVMSRLTYLTRARVLADTVLDQFYSPDQGEFITADHSTGTPTALLDESLLAQALTRLAQLTGEERYRTSAGQALASWSDRYLDLGEVASSYALAVDQWLEFPLHVVIVGGADDPATRLLLETTLKQYAPARAIEIVDPPRDRARLAALGYRAPASGAWAYVCLGPMCLPPIDNPAGIQQAIANAPARRRAIGESI